MDPAIKQGFAIGLVLAAVAGYVGWRQGWWPSPAVTAKLESIAPGAEPEFSKPAAPKTDRGAPAQPKPETPPPAASSPPAKPDAGGSAALPPPPANSAPAAPKPAVEKGAFDVVRVEPTGEAVVAGRCAANCVVELTANGRTHDKVTADAAGNWAMTPPALAPGDYQLGLKVTGADGESAVSEQSVTVSVPETPKGEVVVVLNEPNAPSRILQRPGQAPAAAKPTAEAAREPATAPKTPAQTVAAVSIGAVDAEKGRLFVQGTAPEGSALRVYLNNALISQPVAGKDQRWSVRVERGLTPGDYVARVDHVEKTSGKVLARAEAKFSYEGEVAQSAPKSEERPAGAKPTEPAPPATRETAAPPVAETAAVAPATPPPGQAPAGPAQGKTTTFAAAPAAPDSSTAPVDSAASGGTQGSTPQDATVEAPATPAASAPDAANPVVASIDTTNVRRGDSLWRISRKTYGSGIRYTVIFTANDKQIRDPALIYPGQVLVLPEDPAKAASRGSAPAQ